ncbi:MAG: hypothetical protein PWP24_2 [Clostridiales bacterium]|nr:hypothetical protein [Clostridiales bacterium]
MRKKTNSSLHEQEKLLFEELRKTKLALDCADSNFQNATDPDLIDCSIYELNAAQHRYKVLLRQAKILDHAKQMSVQH